MRTFQLRHRGELIDGVVFPDGAIALRGRGGLERYTLTFEGLEEAEGELSFSLAGSLRSAVQPAQYEAEPDDHEDPGMAVAPC